MLTRMLPALGLVSALLTSGAWAQASAQIKQGGSGPVPMSAILADLKASAPQTRNAAAYQLPAWGPRPRLPCPPSSRHCRIRRRRSAFP